MTLFRKLKELFKSKKKNTARGYIIEINKDENKETFIFKSNGNKPSVLTEHRINGKVVYPYNFEDKALELFLASLPERNKRILTIAECQKRKITLPVDAIMELRKEEELKRLKTNRQRLIRMGTIRERE